MNNLTSADMCDRSLWPVFFSFQKGYKASYSMKYQAQILVLLKQILLLANDTSLAGGFLVF